MPIKYIPFIPEPVEGQAVLGNFNRILKYKGADDVSMVLQRGMPLYEMEKQETVGGNPDGNLVIRGECVSACAYLKDRGIQVDLVYIDPPFASGADYAKKVYIRRNPKVAEAIAQAEQELDIDELKAFEEKMYGDVWDKEKYLNWMYENLMAIKSVMSETASIYVHLDFHVGHYVKILLDEIFGEDNYQNDIYWYYYNKLHGATKQVFPRATDMILYYVKNREAGFTFHHLTEEREKPIKKLKYSFVNGHIQNDKDESGKSITYLSTERQIDNVWKISMLQPADKTEPTGYATQKPEALLERIIKASSNEGMLVADFFGGSGVTAAVSSKLGRRFIHCDIGLNSIQTTRDRLKTDGAQFQVLEIKDGVQLYRNPVQTMDKIKSLIPGLKNEDSLDSFWEGAVTDSRLGTIPVYVPNLMDSSSKLLDVVTMNRIIHQAIPDLDSSIKKVIVYYIDITSEEEIRKFIAQDDSTDVEIELRDLKAVLDGVVIGDWAEFHVEERTDDLFGRYAVVVDAFVSDRVLQKIDEFNQKARMNATAKKPFKPIEISDTGLELIEYLSLDCTAGQGEWHSDSEIKIDKNGFVIRNGEKTKEFWDGTIRSEKKPLRLKIRNICGDETVWEV
ncbi:site-specific DNA-methyltransferase [Pseudoflavonifractor sp. An184]|uniref:DNA-methyltransferase n=1 Tax=Pseudoflavonifractor sp. An184 TaxID=1965576 RepID=UPI000B37B3F2|nr:site-specific DNA-methyltransferase [Pseudoflavonifractor sp. An184]OUP56424.1 site-specific DNA-methyltransferase [Pseudoflavonifractor sp. An184]